MRKETNTSKPLTFRESVKKINTFLRENGNTTYNEIQSFADFEGLSFGREYKGDGFRERTFKDHLEFLKDFGFIEVIEDNENPSVRFVYPRGKGNIKK